MKAPRSQKTLRNGAIQESRMVRHRDGTVSIKKRVVLSPPSRPIPTIPPRKIEPTPEPASAKTVSAMKRERVMKRTVKPDVPVTNEKRGKITKIYEGLTPVSVRTTNKAPDVLKRTKAHYGLHIEMFVNDFESAQGNIRSPDMGGVSGGGQGVPVPLAALQAQERLREFEEMDKRSFEILKLVLIYGRTAQDLHTIMGVQTVVASHLIRDASDAAANFYTPSKSRPNKQLVRIAKWVAEQERKVKT